MSIPSEFFAPHHISDLDDPSKKSEGKYCIDSLCEFDVPFHQQQDDINRIFGLLQHEKSPSAIFTKPELFVSLYSYMKGLAHKEDNEVVSKLSRHKICHEIAERMKKLLQVCLVYVRKDPEASSANESVRICLRSTLKMYCFFICSILSSVAPKSECNSSDVSSQNGRRKRRRETDAGFGNDNSGVDLDGREIALNSLFEMFSPEIISLWPKSVVEGTTLNTVFRMCLHMATQKTNIGGDAQCILSSLSLLLSRVLNLSSSLNSVDVTDLSFPLVDISLRSEYGVVFLCKLVSDIEADESSFSASNALLSAIFESMANAALHDAPNDGSAAKNISVFFSEVSRKSVSVIQRFSNYLHSIMQSESHDVRKGAITSISELVFQKYSSINTDSNEDTDRGKYLMELLFRIMDINLFVRNHALHIWEKLIDSKAVPRALYLLVTEAVIGRLEDKSYLVRCSALSCISKILKKMWFGQVLNAAILEEKKKETIVAAENLFTDGVAFEEALTQFRNDKLPQTDSDGILDTKKKNEEEKLVFSSEQLSILSKVHFYDSSIKFLFLIKKAVYHAVLLLDSKTERDVIEAMQLIATAALCHVDDHEAAILKLAVLVFHSEPKIQFVVRDAFAEIIFSCFNNRSNSSPQTRIMACAQKLVILLRNAREGEISAIERIFAFFKQSSTLSRYVSPQFIGAIWSIAEGTCDEEAILDDRRTAMRIYSILSKFSHRDVDDRKDRIVDFLRSNRSQDNMIITFLLNTLENEAHDLNQFKRISASNYPLQHPILREILHHLCRKTTALSSWMCLARAGVNTIHALCEVPVLAYGYILEYLQDHISRDSSTLAQLCFLVGCTALKQLVGVEITEKYQIKALEEPENKGDTSSDSMQKDLGLGSIEFRRHALQELAQQRRKSILDSKNSLWSELATTVVTAIKETMGVASARICTYPVERICFVVALCQLMIVSENFCSDQLPLLFKIVSSRNEFWAVKTNIVIALGDLACVHPNILSPFLTSPSSGLFKLLKDDDLRVRSVTIQVCSHLVLGEMLRIKEHLFTIVKLVADPDKTIAGNAVTFIRNLALKEKERIGNFIPPLVLKLSSMPQNKFRVAMRTLLERVEGDKPIESLIDRLCQRFDAYNERNKKKLILAENLAFCLSELNFSSERCFKKLTSEPCYQQYRLWLRKSSVLEYFKLIVTKTKKLNRGGSSTRDFTALEEWESRLLADNTEG